MTKEKKHTWPGVSIILCVHNEEAHLHTYLQALLTQDYPEYEVILVNNCSQDHSREEIESYMLRDPRVRLTQIPEHAFITDMRRMAMTLGAKAAKYDKLVFIHPDCRPATSQWLRRMMTPFTEDSRVEAVLGRSGYYRDQTALNRWCRMSLGADEGKMRWALRLHRPNWKVCRNLAVGKALYFRSLSDRYVLWHWNTRMMEERDAWMWSDAPASLKQWYKHKYCYKDGRRKIGY